MAYQHEAIQEQTTPADTRPAAIGELLSLFAFDHLPPRLREISEPFANLAADLVNNLNPGWQLRLGLHQLLAVKDCMVRQRLLDDATSTTERS